MAEYKLLSQEEQVELVENAQNRMDAIASAWLQNPMVKAALLKPEEERCAEKHAS
jgi:hypothetical protein